MDWFTLRVISGKEKKIKETILYNVSTAGMEDKISDILVPSENIVEMKDGKKKIKEKVFFPGYLLVRLEMDKETKYLLENVNGVISFVGPKGHPQPLKKEEAQRFLGNFDGEGGTLKTVEAALERDNFMAAEDAKKWGLIDEIVTQRKSSDEE